MDDDARSVLSEISALLPPRTTVYHSSAAAGAVGQPFVPLVPPHPLVEPVTEPIVLPTAPLPAGWPGSRPAR
ncbi:hypothetical protein [Frankia sp. R82]|uniref:hypothetical protein n=1 Tax=Frankia sp. R82 TaxID=2950553 RepID=UPI002044A42B|nr:hypothetical protein [Frankia sp. R82]MCM3883965.1 hypothetical protein [Frankia sp. R82]